MSRPLSAAWRATPVVVIVAIVLAGALTGCGSEDEGGTVVKDAGPRCTKAATLTKSKGKPTKVEVPRAPVTKLVIDDLKPGTGAAAETGKQLTVNYLGITCSSGQEFDSSWGKKGKNKDDPLKFVLGKGTVIKGWEQGLVGMKEGGLRRLVVPGSLAYGQAGQPPAILSNDTLVFVVDLQKVENAPPPTTTAPPPTTAPGTSSTSTTKPTTTKPTTTTSAP